MPQQRTDEVCERINRQKRDIMIIRELLTEDSFENDKDIYAKLGGGRICPNLSSLYIDREKEVYIRVIGKKGVETPIISYMYYKDEIIEFWIWEAYLLATQGSEDIEVMLPKKMLKYKLQIEDIIREYYDIVEMYSFSPIKRINFIVKLDNVVVKRRFYLENISDENCKDKIEDAINNIDGLAVELNTRMNVAFVSMEHEFDNEYIISVIEKTGNKVIDVKNGFYSWEK